MQLWGEDLVERLAEVYSSKARYCVMFVSQHYVRKVWTRNEQQHAQARALIDKRYILPVRFDDTPVPGLSATVRHEDARLHSPASLAAFVQQKLASAKDKTDPSQGWGNASVSSTASVYLPKFPKQRTEKERDDFLEESFRFVAGYFRDALEQAKQAYPFFDCSFEEVHRQKFVCRAYVNGAVKNHCKIWIGGLSRTREICFAEGRVDASNDNMMNDMLPAVEKDGVLGFQSTLQVGGSGSGSFLSQTQMAAYLWKRFMRPLEQEW